MATFDDIGAGLESDLNKDLSIGQGSGFKDLLGTDPVGGVHIAVESLAESAVKQFRDIESTLSNYRAATEVFSDVAGDSPRFIGEYSPEVRNELIGLHNQASRFEGQFHEQMADLEAALPKFDEVRSLPGYSLLSLEQRESFEALGSRLPEEANNLLNKYLAVQTNFQNFKVQPVLAGDFSNLAPRPSAGSDKPHLVSTQD